MINDSENDHKEIYEQALVLLKSSVGKVDVSFHKGQWEAIALKANGLRGQWP